MTKQLIELENHYFVLSNLLLKHVATDKPQELQKTKAYLARLEPFSVQEKTYYVAELLLAITKGIKQETQSELQATMKKEKLSEATIALMLQYAKRFN